MKQKITYLTPETLQVYVSVAAIFCDSRTPGTNEPIGYEDWS